MIKTRCIAGLLVFQAAAWAGNSVVETELVTDSLKTLPHGEKIQISTADRSFIAVLDEARSPSTEGGVILLPEAGHGPTTQTVIGPLRDYLPDHGWTTLSLHLPVLEPEARLAEYWKLLPEAGKRVTAAVNWWKQKGVKNIVLLGYGWGGLVAATYLAGQPDEAIRAAVFISSGWPPERSREMKEKLDKINVPVLDISAQRDNPEVLDTRLDRRLIFKGKKGYRQFSVSATGHDYLAWSQFLAKRVLGWLRQVAPGVTLVNSD
ncbi:MAG: hypothetical protein AXA67_03145 [Methylothermaceae bacteria B42]|nr:MAG: hypothetical protein AXA67_03145 [Methylothermaceae bacteria B42]HHJ38720.1 DUF3530 family protein [Methylothermaceae bacterium]